MAKINLKEKQKQKEIDRGVNRAKINWKEKKQIVVPAKPEPTKIELELEAQKNYNMQLESTVLELADLVFMMGV